MPRATTDSRRAGVSLRIDPLIMLASPDWCPRARGAAARLPPSPLLALQLALALLLAWGLGPRARADDVSDASRLFQEGNEHFQRGSRMRGERRTRELEAALASYERSLGFVRSRNVLYNTALALEALDRPTEAFNRWIEYLGVEGLSSEEAADARAHRDALSGRVAVFEIVASAEASVAIDRLDLGARGRTPLVIALEPGEHTFYLSAPHHRDARREARGAIGASARVEVTLDPLPVAVQILAPEDVEIELDGAPRGAGRAIDVTPGAHVVRVRRDGQVLAERRFELLVGAPPLILDFSSVGARASAPTEGRAPVVVASEAPATIELDGASLGVGTRVATALAAGEHELRVSAPGRRAYVGRFAVERDPLRLDVRLARERDDGILALQLVTGALAIAATATTVALVVMASEAHEDNLRARDRASADRLTEATLAVDVAWPVALVLASVSVGLLTLDVGGGESEVSLSLAPAAGGASFALRGPIGGSW